MATIQGRRLLLSRGFRESLLLAACCLVLSSCASLMSSVTSQLAGDLSYTVLNSDDPETVRAGAPAYLLLVDALLRRDPDNAELLRIASSLNGAFAAAFVSEPKRAAQLADKSFDYAVRAWCIELETVCEVQTMPFMRFEEVVAAITIEQTPAAYSVGAAWTGWIQAHTDDWNAIAQLSRVKGLMERLIELDETHDLGGPHLYMGGLESLFPKSMGGRPEKSSMHFERALEISGGRNLTAKVIYAERYARLIFDRELHDRLLREVLAADPELEGVTLANRIAQSRAQQLLISGEDYF